MKHFLKNSKLGFTLLEVLIVLAIISILAVATIILIDPVETMARTRDTKRLEDLEGLNSAIELAMHSSNASPSALMCFNTSVPCSGRSDINGQSLDGTGWVKINLKAIPSVQIPTLPRDSINNNQYHYTYYSNGIDYEINVTLESKRQKTTMKNDGGNNDNVYETGTKLNLLP